MLTQEIKAVHKLCRAKMTTLQDYNFTEHKIKYINNYRYNNPYILIRRGRDTV